MEKPRVAAKWRRSGMGSKETVATAKEKGALAKGMAWRRSEEMVWRRSGGWCGDGRKRWCGGGRETWRGDGRQDGVATVGGWYGASREDGMATVGRMAVTVRRMMAAFGRMVATSKTMVAALTRDPQTSAGALSLPRGPAWNAWKAASV